MYVYISKQLIVFYLSSKEMQFIYRKAEVFLPP